MTNEKKKKICEQLVKTLVGEALADNWWSTPNRAFDYKTPFVAFEQDPDTVYDYLTWHAFCV